MSDYKVINDNGYERTWEELYEDNVSFQKYTDKLEKENEELKDRDLIIAVELTKLQDENKQLKDNWNKLKEIAKSQSGFKKQVDLKGGLWFEVDDLLNKMQELEKGSK